MSEHSGSSSSSTSASSLDLPKRVRTGEELDVPKLQHYLEQHIEHFQGPLVVEQFPSGHSNLTYLLRGNPQDAQQGIPQDTIQEWVLRCPPKGAKHIKKGHDMEREFQMLSRLYPVYPKIPRPLLYCGDEDVIGAPFYLMQRIRGVVLRQPLLSALHFDAVAFRTLGQNFVEELVQLHAVDVHATGLISIGRPEGYVERQVKGWSERYRTAQTDEWSEIENIMVWLPQHLPAPTSEVCLLHNDYRYDNLVLHPHHHTDILAILDWELATVGDPLMDLGTTLGYWITPQDPEPLQALPFCLTTQPGNFSRQQLVDLYAERSGRDVSGILFYYIYGLFKIAVICQQIFFRYHKGYTQDERFAYLNFIVQLLGQVAQTSMESGRLEKNT